MNIQRNGLVFSGVVALVGGLLLALWLTAGISSHVGRSDSRQIVHRRGLRRWGEAAGATVVGQPKRGDGTLSAVAGEWPGFRDVIGRNLRRRRATRRQWPAAGPPVLWRLRSGKVTPAQPFPAAVPISWTTMKLQRRHDAVSVAG